MLNNAKNTVFGMQKYLQYKYIFLYENLVLFKMVK